MSPDTIAVYMRVSTTRQETKLQLRDLLAWLHERGLGWRQVCWYRDRGESSTAVSRPAWDRLMASVRASEVKTLLVWKIDRLNRWDAKEHLRWRLEVDQFGVRVVSVTEPDADRFTETLDLMRELFQADGRAKWLRDHRERITRGVRASIAGGKRWGGLAKYRLTQEQDAEMVRRVRDGELSKSAAAREYGVNRETVRKRLLASTPPIGTR